MFNRKPRKEIVPYPNDNDNNKIKPSSTAATNGGSTPPANGLSTDILNQMLNLQQISNYEYMELALLKQILAKLTSIEVSCTQTAVSTEFTGRYVQNKFKWF